MAAAFGFQASVTAPLNRDTSLHKSIFKPQFPLNFESEPGYIENYNSFTTFSNVLFDADYEFDSVDDQSLSDEDISKKIFSNPLFDEEIIPMKIDQHHYNAESTYDSSLIIYSKIDSLLDELLYDNSSPRPPEEFVSKNSNAKIESFFPSPIPIKDIDSFMEEIDLPFNPDDPMPPSIEEDDNDCKRDILILEELLDNYSLSFPNEGDNSEQKVPMPGLMTTRVSNQEKSPDLLSHRGLKNFQLSAKCPMMIHGKNIPTLDVPLFYFYPLDQLKYGGTGSSSAT
uniref:Reverse transcriptase domain-containing protein n=1 Tax=Tanacetum cinerariifolium TaxID=118510 RepID=A0A6L2N8I5_TANCI|nr:hypothetical protein [Tanacetum cinerariifolium]